MSWPSLKLKLRHCERATKFDKISHFLLLLSSVKSSGIFLQIFVAWFFFLVAPNHMLKMAHIFLVFSEYLLYYWIPNVAHCYKEFNSRPKKSKRFSILSSSLLQCLQRSSFFNLQNKSVVAKSSHPIPRYILRKMVE